MPDGWRAGMVLASVPAVASPASAPEVLARGRAKRTHDCLFRLFTQFRRLAMKLSKRLLLSAAAAASLLSLSGVASAETALEGIQKAKLIKIAIPTDFPPYGFVGVDLKPQGLDIDMANYIGTKMGVKVELVIVTSANRIAYLQTKKADLVISTLGKNAEREKVIDFTAAYSPFFQAIYGAKSLNVKSIADLSGKSIAVTRGAIEDQELTKIAPAGADLKRFEDNNATVSAFVAGQTQLVATGASVAGVMMQRNPQLNAEYKLLLKDSPNFIGVAKGEDALRTRVNAIIAEAKKSGDIDKMAQKWLGRPAGQLPE
jgi:polar amino acid transport system substrate-binding protein